MVTPVVAHTRRRPAVAHTRRKPVVVAHIGRKVENGGVWRIFIIRRNAHLAHMNQVRVVVVIVIVGPAIKIYSTVRMLINGAPLSFLRQTVKIGARSRIMLRRMKTSGSVRT